MIELLELPLGTEKKPVTVAQVVKGETFTNAICVVDGVPEQGYACLFMNGDAAIPEEGATGKLVLTEGEGGGRFWQFVERAKIKHFRDIYSFLSNFYYIRVEYEGVLYASVEHAYQAAKTLDLAERLTVQHAGHPGKAKRAGRKVTLRSDWQEVKVGVMRDLLRHKFRYPVLKALLLNTGDRALVEGNDWHDQFWGDCICPLHVGKPGGNMLGKLLMEVRGELHG